MLLLATAALAGPLAPSGLSGPGLEVSAYTGSQTAWVRQAACTKVPCDGGRADTLVGGEVSIGIARPVGVYVHGAWVQETIEAGHYGADGYTYGGGLQGRVDLGALTALHAWVGVDHQYTAGTSLGDQAEVLQVDTGLVLRGGHADDGLQGWVGVGFVPWSSQYAHVLDDAVELTLVPHVPVEGIAGLQLVSDPLGGPWARTRLAAGVSGSVGYRSGIVGFISLLH